MKVDRRFSPVARTIWSHPKFDGLSKPNPNAQSLVLRLLIAPEMTSIPGLYKAWDATLAADLRWPLRAFRKCLEEAIATGWVEYDAEKGIFWIPGAIEQDANHPASPNVVRGWRSPLAELPSCELKARAVAKFSEWVKKKGGDWVNAFEEALGTRRPMASPNPSGKGQPKPLVKPSPNQEQEQEPEQEPPTPTGGSMLQPEPDQPSTLPGSFGKAMKVPVALRCRLAGERKDLADFANAHEWPEIVEAASVLASAMRITSLRLAPFSKDSNVRALAGILASGFSLDELKIAATKIPNHPWLHDKRKLSAVTVPMLNELLAAEAALPALRTGHHDGPGPADPAIAERSRRAFEAHERRVQAELSAEVAS